MKIKNGILKRALEEAESSSYYPKIGSVIFRKSNIISSGHNGIRANSIHPKYQNYANSLHAEQHALIGLDWSKLNKCNILVIRIGENNKLRFARPCEEKCFPLIRHIGLKFVYYSNYDGKIVKEKI